MIERRLPNGWKQPTFLDVADDGSLNIEWCFGERPNDYRVSFWWDPLVPGNEGAACKTMHTGQILEQGANAGKTLAKWLNEEAAANKEETK